MVVEYLIHDLTSFQPHCILISPHVPQPALEYTYAEYTATRSGFPTGLGSLLVLPGGGGSASLTHIDGLPAFWMFYIHTIHTSCLSN